SHGGVEKFSKENNSYSVHASEVTGMHMVSYKVEHDLTPLILSYCQYQVEQGGETLEEFDLKKIQQHIRSCFFQDKPQMTLKVGWALMLYSHVFFFFIAHNQSTLPNLAMGAIIGELQSSSDACEACQSQRSLWGFYAQMVGIQISICMWFVQEILQMGIQTTPVLKALSRCQLKHAIALWQFLSACNSEQLFSRYKADISRESAKLLSTSLYYTDLDAFFMELHEMMVLKVRNTHTQDSFNPEWSLRDILVSYTETKKSKVFPEVESQFPEEILLPSCVFVWKVKTTGKQDL
uniref:Uncharacterized protein n=1 Tax=Spermophilus dauricus TaxID=99837 RepID=A0A8C9PUA8_SPEDA